MRLWQVHFPHNFTNSNIILTKYTHFLTGIDIFRAQVHFGDSSTKNITQCQIDFTLNCRDFGLGCLISKARSTSN